MDKIILDDKDVNLSVVTVGLAWWYRKYANEQLPADRVLYEDAEKKARSAQIGLWHEADPIPPWEWRHRR